MNSKVVRKSALCTVFALSLATSMDVVRPKTADAAIGFALLDGGITTAGVVMVVSGGVVFTAGLIGAITEEGPSSGNLFDFSAGLSNLATIAKVGLLVGFVMLDESGHIVDVEGNASIAAQLKSRYGFIEDKAVINQIAALLAKEIEAKTEVKAEGLTTVSIPIQESDLRAALAPTGLLDGKKIAPKVKAMIRELTGQK